MNQKVKEFQEVKPVLVSPPVKEPFKGALSTMLESGFVTFCSYCGNDMGRNSKGSHPERKSFS